MNLQLQTFTMTAAYANGETQPSVQSKTEHFTVGDLRVTTSDGSLRVEVSMNGDKVSLSVKNLNPMHSIEFGRPILRATSPARSPAQVMIQSPPVDALAFPRMDEAEVASNTDIDDETPTLLDSTSGTTMIVDNANTDTPIMDLTGRIVPAAEAIIPAKPVPSTVSTHGSRLSDVDYALAHGETREATDQRVNRVRHALEVASTSEMSASGASMSTVESGRQAALSSVFDKLKLHWQYTPNGIKIPIPKASSPWRVGQNAKLKYPGWAAIKKVQQAYHLYMSSSKPGAKTLDMANLPREADILTTADKYTDEPVRAWVITQLDQLRDILHTMAHNVPYE